MNNKKVLFFDIDGTILTPGERIIEPSTLETLKLLKDNKDIDMFISSGRGLETLKEIDYIIPYFKGLNLANGCQIVIDGKCYNEFIEKEYVSTLVKYLCENKISFAILSSLGNLRMYYNDEIKKRFDTAIKSNYIMLKEGDDFYFDKVIELWILDDNSVIEKVENKFKNLTFFRWGKFGADVVRLGMNKGKGIKKIIQKLDYDYNNTFAFGDSDNDVAMFKAVKTSIVMKKSSSLAAENATYMTTDIKDDGIKNAVFKYVLNKKSDS